MRKYMMVAVAVGALMLPAAAQEKLRRVEVFGGYQFTHFEPSINASGWNAAGNGNITRWVGVTGDFSGSYKHGAHLYTYMIGPTFSARTKRLTPFAHALFGVAGSCGSCDAAFTMALGGGLDANANDHFAVRLIQADWLVFRSGGFSDKKNARVSAGVVVRF
jgi:opacity protein-like surface antigen